jgi:hypothetical protein
MEMWKWRENVIAAPPAVPPNRQLPDNRWLLAWDRRSFLELGSYESAPGCARRHATGIVAEWSLGQHAELTRLIVSELVTNSVVAVRKRSWTELPPVRLWVLGDASRVNLLVWDALPCPPRPRTASQEDENGRGLFIVQELSAAWGSYLPPDSYYPEHAGGKVTWAIIGPQGIQP